MPRNAPIQSIERAVRILFAVAGAEEGRTVAQIAAATDLKAGTAWRLARTLEDMQMLERTRADASPSSASSPSPSSADREPAPATPLALRLRFRIGAAVGELKQLDDGRHLIAVARRALVRWQARLPSCNLGLVERIGHESCERVRVTSARTGTAVIRRTRLHHPYGKASPLLFLAYAGPDERDDFFHRHPFAPEGRQLWGDRARLDGFLADVCRRGYASPEFPDGKWFRVAVPVFSSDGHLAAAVGGYVETDASARTRTRLIACCRDAAAEIGRQL
ncbi:MAG: helix-turn-helix domain-containing protein [Opitutaceae bacterium]|jgi:DNA-binding IclR family transcriptional regulator|nr:helix-turn-helix domain-containing protein [Opitutaceae bacterium]